MFAPEIEAPATIQNVCDALLESDRHMARALGMLSSIEVESRTGLPTEMLLILGGRRTGTDARMIVQAATTMRAMPAAAQAFDRGEISWPQFRAITTAVRSVDAAARAHINQLIAKDAPRLSHMDPDELIAKVEDAAASFRSDLTQAKEDRRIEARFLAFQPRLDGSATIYGEADPESAAIISKALDAHAETPLGPGHEGLTRAQQHMDAFVGICETYLAGGDGTTRPRPRLIATVDVAALQDNANARGAKVLWNLVGRAPRLTPLSTEMLFCDAQIQPVIFSGSRPVAVWDATSPISSALRTALIARDGGCLFPSCGAPVSWCDAHHIKARIKDGPTAIDNLLLLCRRCHRRVHRQRWKITMADGGVIEFQNRGYRYASSPQVSRRE